MAGKRITGLTEIAEGTSLADFFAEIDKEGLAESLKVSLHRLMQYVANENGTVIAKGDGDTFQTDRITKLGENYSTGKFRYPSITGSLKMFSTPTSLGFTDVDVTIDGIVNRLKMGEGFYGSVIKAYMPQIDFPINCDKGELMIIRTSVTYCRVILYAINDSTGKTDEYNGISSTASPTGFKGWTPSDGILMGGVITAGVKTSYFRKDFTVGTNENLLTVIHNLDLTGYNVSLTVENVPLIVLPYQVNLQKDTVTLQFNSGVDASGMDVNFAILNTTPQV